MLRSEIPSGAGAPGAASGIADPEAPPIPPTRDEAAATMCATLRRQRRAGHAAPYLLRSAHALVADWPAAVRPGSAEIETCVGFVCRPRDAAREDPFAAADAPPVEAAKQPLSAAAPSSAEFVSERLLAERLAASPLTRALRYLPAGPDAGWRQWDGTCWAPCFDRLPCAFLAAVHREVGSLLASGQLDLRLARHLESTNAMRGVLTQVEAYASIRLAPSDTDPPGHLPTMCGLLDLALAMLSDHDPTASTWLRCAAVGWDPDAQHELWDVVAAHVAALPGGAIVQRFLGAALLGIPPDRKLLFLVGDGGDGKSTLLRSAALALGEFATAVPAEALAGDGRGAHGHELLSGLASARLAIATEVGTGLDWGLCKALTGGDVRATKRLHGRLMQVQPKAWLAIACNHRPRPPDAASRDRCIVVDWRRPDDPDPGIVALLATPGGQRNAYLRACLRWLVDGCRQYQRDGLGVPDFARAEVEPIGLVAWYEEDVAAGRLVPGVGWATFAALAERAAEWHRGQDAEPPSDKELGIFLRGRLAAKRRTPNNTLHYAITRQDRTTGTT